MFPFKSPSVHSPKSFFWGIFSGLLALSLLGRCAAQNNIFPKFTRFIDPIGPAQFFYPTIFEIHSLAHARVPKEKVLVVVGGNSIFHGIGQSASELWTIKLGELLGENFEVLNFAMPGASPAEFGGVAFASLSLKYPKILFVSDLFPGIFPSLENKSNDDYLLWDAHYKGLYPQTDPKFNERVNALRSNELSTAKGLERHVGRWLDARLYFSDLWNFISHEYFQTVLSSQTAKHPFRPRRLYIDPPGTRTEFAGGFQKSIAKHPEWLTARLQQFETENALMTQSSSDGSPRINEEHWQKFMQNARDVMPESLRAKSLFAVIWSNRYFVGKLPLEGQRRYALGVSESVRRLRMAGYRATDIGRDFPEDDYEASMHYFAPGGDKVARELVPRLQQMAIDLGYLP